MRRLAGAGLAALLIAGCGGGGGQPAQTAAHATARYVVTLDLKGGAPISRSECGAPHHFTRYRAGHRIEFAGSVRPVPTGRWKVKLKIKQCGSAGTLAKVTATRDKHSGAFRGMLPGLARGAYFARASLYVAGRKVARSDKRHFSLG